MFSFSDLSLSLARSLSRLFDSPLSKLISFRISLFLFSDFFSSFCFSSSSALIEATSSSDWFFCFERSSSCFWICSSLARASLLFLFFVIASSSLMYWFVRSASCFFWLASISSFLARSVAVAAMAEAVLASSFSWLIFTDSSFFFVASVIVLRLAVASSACFCKAVASAVFWVARSKASWASCFRFLLSFSASMASVLAMLSSCSFVTFLFVLLPVLAALPLSPCAVGFVVLTALVVVAVLVAVGFVFGADVFRPLL